MQHRIEHREPLFGRGVNLIIHLVFSPEEEEIIRKNNMARLTIVEADPTHTTVVSKDGKKKRSNRITTSTFRTSINGEPVGTLTASLRQRIFTQSYLRG